MSLPVILWDNLLEDGPTFLITGGEDPDFPIANAYDWLTFDWWKASGSGTSQNIRMDFGASVTADAFAIFAHNMDDSLDSGDSLQVAHSNDNFASDINTVVNITGGNFSKQPYVYTFSSASNRYWRISFAGTPPEKPLAGVLWLGQKLELLGSPRQGFAPPNLSPADNITNMISQGGHFIGRSVLQAGVDFDLDFDFLTPAFVRSDIAPFLEHAKTKPFFYSWDNGNYPNEAVFGWVEKKLDPVPYSHDSLYMRMNLKCKGMRST